MMVEGEADSVLSRGMKIDLQKIDGRVNGYEQR